MAGSGTAAPSVMSGILCPGVESRHSCFYSPIRRQGREGRRSARLVDLVDKAHEVMAEHLQQGFVLLSDGRLAPNGVGKVSLHRRKRGLRVTAEQKQALMDAAGRDGLELSAWLRQLALRAAGALPSRK